MTITETRTPWIANLGDVPATLDYFQGSMYEAVEKIAEKYPDYIAYDFMGRSTTYKKFVEQINLCARALKAIGIREGDKITICMPNCPQTVIMFYAVNLVGGIANMVHPLSSEKEIEFYLKESGSICALTLDQFYHKFEAIRQNVESLNNVIIASIKDELSKPIKVGYMLTEGRKIQKIPADAPIIRWKEFFQMGNRYRWKYKVKKEGKDAAVILYSGGTTGITKGILLSNLNFNALGQQIIATNPMFRPGDKMLAVMPMFHGFGLGVSIHSMLSQGGRCVLVPRFTPQSYAKLILKDTLFESNHADSYAGALISGSSATVTASGVRFAGNSATGDGGAVMNYNVGTFKQCVFEGNIAYEGSSGLFDATCGGGAIFNQKGSGSAYLSITDCLFADNRVDGGSHAGGAINNYGGATLVVVNTTFHGNGAASGGAVYNDAKSKFYAANSTFAFNEAVQGDGAIRSLGTAFVLNSIAVGDTLTYTLDAFEGETFVGTVTKIYAVGTKKQNATYFDVRITLPSGKALLPGMNGTVTIDK